jgi:hypothetical protein
MRGGQRVHRASPAASPSDGKVQRERRRFFKRDWRSLRGLRLGLVMANVALPTRRTFHSFSLGWAGAPLWFGSMISPPDARSLVRRLDYTRKPARTPPAPIPPAKGFIAPPGF